MYIQVSKEVTFDMDTELRMEYVTSVVDIPVKLFFSVSMHMVRMNYDLSPCGCKRK